MIKRIAQFISVLIASVAVGQVTIPQLPPATLPLSGSEQVVLQQNGVTVQAPMSAVTSAPTNFANPTALVGTTPVNGSATTGIRSDGAPAINQTMSPTMTGAWTFTPSGSNPAININSASAQNGISVHVPASGSPALNVAGPAATTTGLFQLQESGQSTWEMFEGASSNTFHLWNNVQTDVMTFAGPGNVNVLAPASGVAFTTTGVGGSVAANFVQTGSTANSVALEASTTGNTTNGQVFLNFDINGNAFLYNQIASTFNLGNINTNNLVLVTGNSSREVINGNGDVTINNPTSGAPLTVNGAAGGSPILTLTDATESLTFPFDASHNAFLGVAGAHNLNIFTNGSANTRLAINSNGNVTVQAPASGVAFTTNGIAGQFAGVANGANSATGSGFEVLGNFTGAGNTNLLTVSDGANTNGANIELIGNGTNPNKFIRAQGGSFQILNSAYTSQLFALTDAGNVTYTSTGASPQWTFTSSGVAAGFEVNAPATFGASLFLAANGNTTGTSMLFQQDTSHNGFVRNQDTGSLFLGTGSTNWGNVNSTGNWTLSAPTSGNTFTATGVSTGFAGNFKSAASGTEDGLYVGAGAASGDIAVQVQNQAGATDFLKIFGDGHGQLGPNGTNDLTWNTSGQFTVNAPSVGVAFTVNGVGASNVAAANFNPGTVTDDGLQVSGISAGQGSIAFNANLGADTSRLGVAGAANQFFTGTAVGDTVLTVTQAAGTIRLATSTNTDRMDIAPSGQVTINAPAASTIAFKVNGVNGTNSATFQSGTTTGSSFGPAIFGGTNSTDYGLIVENAGGTQNLIQVFGDGGLVVGNGTPGGDTGGATVNAAGHLVNGIQQTVTGETSAPVTITTTDTYLFSPISIPASSLFVGAAFRITAWGAATSTVANTVQFSVRFGTAGTTADTAVFQTGFNSATGGTGNAWKATFYVHVVSIGATGSMAGGFDVINASPTGNAGIAQAPVTTNPLVNTTTVNTTVASKLGLSLKFGAATTSATVNALQIERLF